MSDIRTFKNFLKVVETGSLSRAAEHIGITQPGLSQQIASLEEDFGQPLLHRTPRGVTPTEAGELLHARLQAIIRQYEAARDDLAYNRGAPEGTSVIGLPNSVAEILSIPLIEAARMKYPGIFPRIGAMPNRLAAEHLAGNRTDMALLFGDAFNKGIRSVAIGRETLFLLCSPHSPFSESDGEIDLKDLAGRKLVLPCQPHHVRVILEAYALTQRIDIRVAAEIDSLSNLIALTETGEYESVLPWSAIYSAVTAGRIHARPLPQLTQRTLSICVSDQVPLTEATRAMLELVQEQIETLVYTEQWQGMSLFARDKRADTSHLLARHEPGRK